MAVFQQEPGMVRVKVTWGDHCRKHRAKQWKRYSHSSLQTGKFSNNNLSAKRPVPMADRFPQCF